MVSARPLISNTSNHRIKSLKIVPCAPITIGITVTFIFHIFFSFARPTYLSLFLFSLISICGPLGQQSLQFGRLSLLLTITKSDHLAGIRWSVYISKSQIILCASFSWTDSGLVEWSRFNFLHNYQWIPLPTQSCLVLFSFCAGLLLLLLLSLLLTYFWCYS